MDHDVRPSANKNDRDSTGRNVVMFLGHGLYVNKLFNDFRGRREGQHIRDRVDTYTFFFGADFGLQFILVACVCRDFDV